MGLFSRQQPSHAETKAKVRKAKEKQARKSNAAERRARAREYGRTIRSIS